MIRPEDHITFAGRDWQLIKAWLEEVKENKIGLLIQSETEIKSNQIRGSIAMLNEILALEKKAAAKAAQ
jgi:hypothetical protein